MLDINHLAPGHMLIRTTKIEDGHILVLAENPHHYVTWIEGWFGTITGHYFMKFTNGPEDALHRAEVDFEERIRLGF